ncbi:MAG TPA: ATP-binding protein [bacterium]|nr:ATP-binding protein [bacterium]
MTRFSGKIFFLYLIFVLAAMVAVNLLLLRFIENLQLTNARQSLQEKWIDSYPNLQGLTISEQRKAFLGEKLRQLAKDGIFHLALYDLSGNFLADSEKAPGLTPGNPTSPEIRNALRDGHAFALLPVGSDQPHWLYFARLTEDAVFRVGVSTDSIYRTLSRIRLFFWLGAGVLIGVSWLFYYVLARRADEALRRFKKMIKGLEEGNFSQRIPVVGNDEVGQIGQSMNSLARELEAKIRSLAEERNRLKTILDAMQEGVIVLNGSGNIVLFNPAMRLLFGLEERNLGRPTIEVFRNVELQSIVERCLSGETVEKRELRIFRAGQEHFLMVQATAFSEGAVARGAIVVMYDITHLRRLERVRRDFVANVSHELKTPLTSIGGYVETLLDGAWTSPDQAKSFLGIIDSNARRLGKLVEDLLRLSEIESQAFILKPESFRVQELFGEVLDLHDTLLKKKGMSIDVAIEPESLALYADRSALLHVLNNLVENAIKYGHSNTAIQLECRAEGESASFRVEDQGIGIGKLHLERVFERFYRVDKARSQQEGGTGLGLAIVKHLVQLMGGEIEVESVPEQGSVFRFRLEGIVSKSKSS